MTRLARVRSRLAGERAFAFENNKAGTRPANVFLLTHKCGNHYIADAFRRSDPAVIHFQNDDLTGQMPGPYVGRSREVSGGFQNIRCRNFSALSIEKLLTTVDVNSTEFFLFVRHPASLFRSAVSYHLRGSEKWAVKQRYSYLNYRTLTEALNEAQDLESRLVIAMTHFGIAWRLVDNWVNCYHFLETAGASFTVVRSEDLFSNGQDDYFETLSEKMTHHGFRISSHDLKFASPRFMDAPPAHSTGEFKKSSLSGYTGRALQMYNQYFLECQRFFYDDWGQMND